MESVAARPARSRGALAWMLFTQLLYLFSLIPWFVLAGLSLLAFDSAGSSEHWVPYAFVGAIGAYPLILLLCVVFAWARWRRGRTRAALVWGTVPLLLAGPVLVYMFWAAAPAS